MKRKRKRKEIIYLYIGRFKPGMYRASTLGFKNNGNVIGEIIRGYGSFFYFISKNDYKLGTLMFKEDIFLGRPIVFGVLKEKKKLLINLNRCEIHMRVYPFFQDHYGEDTDKIRPSLIYKILERKDYEQIYN